MRRHHYREPSLIEEILIFICGATLVVCVALVAILFIGLMSVGVWDGLHSIAKTIQ